MSIGWKRQWLCKSKLKLKRFVQWFFPSRIYVCQRPTESVSPLISDYKLYLYRFWNWVPLYYWGKVVVRSGIIYSIYSTTDINTHSREQLKQQQSHKLFIKFEKRRSESSFPRVNAAECLREWIKSVPVLCHSSNLNLISCLSPSNCTSRWFLVLALEL